MRLVPAPKKVPSDTCLPDKFAEGDGVLPAADVLDPAVAEPDAGSLAGSLTGSSATCRSNFERKAVGAAPSRRAIVASNRVVSKSRMPSMYCCEYEVDDVLCGRHFPFLVKPSFRSVRSHQTHRRRRRNFRQLFHPPD